jgi:hypothetical protein
MVHFWKLLLAALILSLLLGSLGQAVRIFLTDTGLEFAVTIVLTFLVLCGAHWWFGAQYVSWQPDLVHRQYNLLWAAGV